MTIQRVSGVLLDVDDARYVASALDHLCATGPQPARLAHIAKQLRKAVANASPAASLRASQRDSSQSANCGTYDLLTAGEVAEALDCTLANVRDLRRRGQLPAHRAGREFLYPALPVLARAERKAQRRERAG